MTSSGGRDPVFQNTQLWAHWEFSINNSGKNCHGGTSFNYFFFQFQIFGSMCLSLAWFPRGSSLPEAPVKMINSFPTAPSPPHPHTSRNTWSSQDVASERTQDACWVWKGTQSSRTQWVERGSQEKCFGSTHLHSCQMAKLGLPVLLPAVGLWAVLSLTPETKYA